ncbi:hypothetical protein C1J03_02105 [Sulfitobacter sp. SK012]|nr:hypothetical protein C1J03_02105 [Sulfitobacter sp. SK012]
MAKKLQIGRNELYTVTRSGKLTTLSNDTAFRLAHLLDPMSLHQTLIVEERSCPTKKAAPFTAQPQILVYQI